MTRDTDTNRGGGDVTPQQVGRDMVGCLPWVILFLFFGLVAELIWLAVRRAFTTE
jgi:hypothetical protein